MRYIPMAEYSKWCFDRDCNECKFKIDCLNFVGYTDTEREDQVADEEYRPFVKELDDTKDQLIATYTKRWMKKFNLTEKAARKLVIACYLTGWNLKDSEKVAEDRGILYLEKYVAAVLSPVIKEYLAECIEHTEDSDYLEYLDYLSEEDLDFIPDEKWMIDLLVHMLYRNFTGEVRISPVQEDQEKDVEQRDENENLAKIQEVKRLLKSIVFAKSGKLAYELSEKVKALCNNGLSEWRKELNKAWHTRRLLKDFSLEEKMKKYKEFTQWVF